MSNVFRLAHLDQIKFQTELLPHDDPLYRIHDERSTSDPFAAILSSGWIPPRHPLSYPIRNVDGFTIWSFSVSSNDSDIVAGQCFPAQDDPNRLTAIAALNGALQLNYHRRITELKVPFVPIDFFIIDGDPGSIFAYADTNNLGLVPDPISYLGDADFSINGVRADLVRQSNALLLQTSLTTLPSSLSNVSTPRVSPSISKMNRAPAISPATRDTGPRTYSSSCVKRTPTGSTLATVLHQDENNGSNRSADVSSSKFVIEPHPLAKVVTLPDVISIRFGTKLSRFVPRPIQYGPISRTPEVVAGAEDVMDIEMDGSNGAGNPQQQSYVTDTSSDSEVQSSASMLMTTKPSLTDPIDASVLLLIQQHVHDPFFAAMLAQASRQTGPIVSVPFPVYLPQSCSSSHRMRQLMLASSTLPSWRAVTNPLPIQQTNPDQVPDLAESATIDQIVVNDCDLLLGFDGDIRTLSAAAVEFWEESCLEPFKSKADVSFVLIPPYHMTTTEKTMLIEPFIEAVSSMYETSMLGHHTPIKCYQEILSLPTQFQESIGISSDDSDHAGKYYEFILDAMNSSAMRSKMTSTETSVVVIYIIVDNVRPTDLRHFSSFVNRLRLILGAPTWSSTSRRKNVVGQIVPLSLLHGFHVSNEFSPISSLRQLVFSVFSRNHFVPAIPIDSELNPKLNTGLGMTSFEPAFVVHNEHGIPNPTQAGQRLRLAVHIAYVTIRTDDGHEWIIGCATDMRGERLHTVCFQRMPGQPLSSSFEALWIDCLRPVLDFLHSRTDQGPMTIAVFKLGAMSPEECSTWPGFLAYHLGGDWAAFRQRVSRSNSLPPVKVTKSGGAPNQSDSRLAVSTVFLISCPRPASLQMMEELNLQNNSFILHQHQLLQEYDLHPSIVNADLFFRDGSSVRCQLERFIVHGDVEPLSYAFIVDAFRAVIQQTLALNVFSPGPGTGLPLHLATAQRLALSMAALLKQANQSTV